MIRIIAEGTVLFLLPFAGFATWLYLKGFNPLEASVWSRKAITWLTFIALALCMIAVLWIGATRTMQQGIYVPSQVRDGVFVPGHFRPAP
jgi:hypothetical protein